VFLHRFRKPLNFSGLQIIFGLTANFKEKNGSLRGENWQISPRNLRSSLLEQPKNHEKS
jgi:hypothetical protein